MSERSEHPHESWADEPLGTTAEELTRLFEALGDWAKESRSEAGVTAGHVATTLTALAGQAADAAGRFAESLDEHVDTGAPECTYCPLCRTVHVIRESSPEVKVHVANAASSLMHAAAAVLHAAGGAAEGAGHGADHGTESGAGGTGEEARATRTERVERIDLDGWDDDPADRRSGGWEQPR